MKISRLVVSLGGILGLVSLLVAGSAGPAPAAPPVKTITLKVQSQGGPTNAYRLAIERVIKILESQSGGRIKVDYYPANALVAQKEVFSAVSQGILDIAQQSTTYNVGTLGGIAVFNHMPWNFDPADYMKNYRKVGYYDYMNQRFMKQNTRLLTNLVQPSGDLVWKEKHPVKVLEDLKGQIVATNQGMFAFFKILGAEPFATSTNERYEAMQRGIVDVLNFGASIAVSSRYWEVANGITIVNTSAGSNFHIMNLGVYKSLPPDLQKLIDDAVLETEKIHAAETEKAQKADQEKLAKEKMEVYILPKAERERWKEATQAAYDPIKKRFPKEWEEFGKMWPSLR